MTDEEVRAFVVLWISAWNARDVQSLLDLVADGVLVTDPVLVRLTGASARSGRAILQILWSARLDELKGASLVLDRVIWDPSRCELCIISTVIFAERRVRRGDLLRFGPDDRIFEVEGFVGVTFGS